MTSIQRELKQNKPFALKTTEAAVALLRTADLVRRNLAAVIEPHGITVQQYNVLRILRGAGEKGLPTLDIAERMIEAAPGITRLIDRLEAKHLVSRQRCKTDRRQVFCLITSEGLSLLGVIDEPLGVAGERALSALRKRDVDDLLALLDRARDGLHASVASQRALNDASNSRRPSAGVLHRSK
jgi:DNA-binding MarR family transcriptional regulator